MKETRYFYVPNAIERDELPFEEATHAIRVLRMLQGDEMILMDGEGFFHKSVIQLITNKKCFYKIVSSEKQERLWHGRIHLAVAPTKMMERMEWFVEKATEIGVDEISFLSCDFSERKKIRIDRIEKIVISAAKQSRKAWIPKVNDIVGFDSFITGNELSHKYICHCYEEYDKVDLKNAMSDFSNNNGEIVILIGPEGDFSVSEVDKAISLGYTSATLGNSRLRTETAALFAVAMSNVFFRK